MSILTNIFLLVVNLARNYILYEQLLVQEHVITICSVLAEFLDWLQFYFILMKFLTINTLDQKSWKEAPSIF